MTEQIILQLGAIGILVALGIREFFSYLKTKEERKGMQPIRNNGNTILNQSILNELQIMNSNHLHAIREAIEDGNRNLVETIHNDNTKMISVLGEIKGMLSTR